MKCTFKLLGLFVMLLLWVQMLSYEIENQNQKQLINVLIRNAYIDEDYLDYISIEATCGLSFNGSQLIFYNNDVENLNGVGKYVISNSNSLVWSVPPYWPILKINMEGRGRWSSNYIFNFPTPFPLCSKLSDEQHIRFARRRRFRLPLHS